MKDESRHAAADSPSSKFIGRKGQGTPPPEPAALESVQSARSPALPLPLGEDWGEGEGPRAPRSPHPNPLPEGGGIQGRLVSAHGREHLADHGDGRGADQHDKDAGENKKPHGKNK